MPAARQPQHVVIVAGAAVAGSEAAFQLARHGVCCIVLDQNDRPYGKIEDGLPRWHVKLRRQEMDKIDAKLSHSNIHFVPRTRLGRDLSLQEVLGWQPSAVVLAIGAGRDRPLPLPGIDRYVGRGFHYQNPFVSWFNHYREPGYAGPTVQLADGALVIGGGLASLDVVKILMLETVTRALAARGIRADLSELERVGIARGLEERGFTVYALGLAGCRLFYRRRLDDMPLTALPSTAMPAEVEQSRSVRRRLLQSFQVKYLFHFEDRRLPVGYLTEGDRLAGLMMARTEIRDGTWIVMAESAEEYRARLVISAIGSIPEPLPGVEMRGHFYPVRDVGTGEVEGLAGVFVVGNVMTGKGNIAMSQRQGRTVSLHMLERYLAGTATGYEEVLAGVEAVAKHQVAALTARLQSRPPLPADRVAGLLSTAKARQAAVGYPGTYAQWIARVRPAEPL